MGVLVRLPVRARRRGARRRRRPAPRRVGTGTHERGARPACGRVRRRTPGTDHRPVGGGPSARLARCHRCHLHRARRRRRPFGHLPEHRRGHRKGPPPDHQGKREGRARRDPGPRRPRRTVPLDRSGSRFDRRCPRRRRPAHRVRSRVGPGVDPQPRRLHPPATSWAALCSPSEPGARRGSRRISTSRRRADVLCQPDPRTGTRSASRYSSLVPSPAAYEPGLARVRDPGVGRS